MASIVRKNDPGQLATRTEWDPLRMMRDLLRWDPFVEMSPALPTLEPVYNFMPQFDVKETKDGYLFHADLPGVDEKDLDVNLTGNRLVIAGKRSSEEIKEGDTWYCRERSYGAFTRAFTLPEGIDDEHVVADFKNGVLTLTVPKKPEMQPKKINIGPAGVKH